MTRQQTHLQNFADQTEAQSEDTSVLFRWADDPFVNEAAAEIGRQIANQFPEDTVITPTSIEVASSAMEDVVPHLEHIFNHALQNTHRRTTVAHQVNAAVKKHGQGSDDDRWVPTPDRPFPHRSDDDLTIYADDEITIDRLEQVGLPTEDIEYVDSDPSRLFELSPTFIGHPLGYSFENQLNRFHRYLDTLLKTLTGDFDGDDGQCMVCGSQSMPTHKGSDGNDLEFNQSFNILATASAVSQPLGMGGRTTAHSGRCVACLLAGFYYTLMPKVARGKDKERCGGNVPIWVYRIFTPRGDFEELVDIRRDFETNLLVSPDSPTDHNHVRRETLRSTESTPSRSLQTLQFYEAVLKHVNNHHTRDHYSFAVEHRPTALISYTSASTKGGRPLRDVREVETIDPDRWAYDAVRQQTEPNIDEYWPVSDVLAWYTRLADPPTAALDDIGYGILEQNLKRLARGHFEIVKMVERADEESIPYVLPIGQTTHYFNTIMQSTTQQIDSIDQETIESIKRVASNLGQTFHERDDISVLIGLQNASTPNEFLEAFEKASMQAQKKASSADEVDTWSGKNDVATVLKRINDTETFEPAKRMFVIHASLAAQYMNAQHTGGDEE